MLKTLTKLCLYLLAFIPIIVDFKVFFPYTSGKNLFIESFLVLVGIMILINFFYSKTFREEIVDKATKYIKHPLVISIFSFISIFIISTIFAVDKYSAFWGDLSRAEGLAGTIFFFSFFIFSLLTFEKKDWLWFFKLSLFASLILLSKEFIEFFSGIARPGSFTGNPTFLAGYLLFSISSGLIVLSNQGDTLNREKPARMTWSDGGLTLVSKLFKYLAIITIILSVAGIFIAQTRGTILGLGLGIVVALIYCAFKGHDINYKIFNLRKSAIILLTLGLIFSGIFISTRKNDIWQKVPGLSRLAIIGSGDAEDLSTPVRLLVYKAGIDGINPSENGWRKLLIGWGPENFLMVDSKYYNPELYTYETVWHDRSHNKLLDVLVMTGIFGLLAYLAILILLFRYILKKKEFSLVSVGLLTFGISYLVHLMFVFDQISTSIPFFMILAFIVYHTVGDHVKELKKSQIRIEIKEKGEILTGTFLVILTVFLVFVYIKNTLPGYYQMRSYTALIENPQVKTFETDINSVFTPATTAQMNIRRNFLEITNKLYNKNPDELNLRLLKKAIMRAEEYISTHSQNFQFMTTLADLYSRKGFSFKNLEYLKRGEYLLREVLVFAPNRPDINLRLSLNLLYQEKFMESFNLAEKVFDSHKVLEKDRDNFEGVYTSLIKYFYEQKDKENFIKVADRLRSNNYADMESLDKILDYLNKTGKWSNVDFK
jgi:O-antigen ligase